VSDGSRPVYWDRFRLTPDLAARLAGVGGTEACAYLGTLLLAAPGRADWNDVLAELQGLLADQSEIRGGASLLAQDGCIVRFLAPSAPALTAFARAAWSVSRRHLLGLPPLDLRLD